MPQTTRRRPCRWAALAAALAASGLPGCGYLPRAPVAPMPTQLFASPCEGTGRALLVLLPGRGMTLRELQRHGFVEAVAQAKLAVDVLLADAHLGYYKDRTILERLRADVVAPQQRAGRTAIWLAGISLGGLGALTYADAYPGDLRGVLVLAPYLGEPASAATVAQAGGLLRWQAPPQPWPGDEIGHHAWRSAQRLVLARPSAEAAPSLWLGYGLSDRFAASARVLAGALPPARVFTTPGGHDWAAWTALWPRLLAASDLPRCAP